MKNLVHSDIIAALRHCDAPRSYAYCRDCFLASVKGDCGFGKKLSRYAAAIISRQDEEIDSLKEKIRDQYKFIESIKEQNRRYAEEIRHLKEQTGDRPTAYAALVAYNRGIKVMECSACKKRSLGRIEYCPRCGAKFIPFEEDET